MEKGNETMKDTEWKQGLRDGLPIAIGYFSVSFSFGIIAVKQGLTILQSVFTSLTNVTSAGQFAGLQIMVAGGTILEMILTQLIINLRYSLMSLSLSQKLDPSVTMGQRLLMAFANTDEIFAAAMAHQKSLTMRYMVGLQILPVLGWTFGTGIGAMAGDILPKSLCTSLSVALYGMFAAIVVPVARKKRPVLLTVVLAILFSCIMTYVPACSGLSAGIRVIVSTVLAAGISAILFPIPVEDGEEE